MKSIILTIFLAGLLCAPALAASDLEERVSRLEEQVRDLYNLLETRPQQTTASGRSTATDPLVGRWFCSNGAFSSEVFFQPGGQLVQQEPVLGNTNAGRWTRMAEDRISIVGGPNFTLSFDSEDQVTIEETNSRSSWDCERVRE